MRSKSTTFLCLTLAALTCLSLFAPSVLAGEVPLMNAFKPWDGAQWSGSGDYWIAYADLDSGYCRARSEGNAWAFAQINEHFTSQYDASSAQLWVVVSNRYRYRSQPLGTKCKTQWWVRIYDVTAGQTIYDAKKYFEKGKASEWFNINHAFYQNHEYNVIVGFWVETSKNIFGKAKAECRGNIDQMVLTGYT